MDIHSKHNTVADAPSGLALTATHGTVPPTPPRSPSATSTSTSAEASRYQVKQRKVAKNTVPPWQPPDLGNVACCITSTYGQTLREESLVSAALDLLQMEDWMISTTAQQLSLALSTKTDPESEERSRQKLAHLAIIKEQIRQIQRGEAKIHEKYLEEQYLVKYWDEAYGVVLRIMLWDPRDAPNYKSMMTRLTGLEELAKCLQDSLFTAARRGYLTLEFREAMHRKWRIYDQMIDAFHKEGLTNRLSPNWTSVDKELFEDPREKWRRFEKRQSQKKRIAVLWINFAALTVASLSFLGVGFFYSSGAAGRWRDPDFWFLLQSSAVQLGGLFITALSFDSASAYDWAAGSAATIFALIAPVLYVKAPSQYSMLSSAVGGVFQALLILQRSLCDLADGS